MAHHQKVVATAVALNSEILIVEAVDSYNADSEREDTVAYFSQMVL